MIRPSTADDRSALVSLCEATGLFEPAELLELTNMLGQHFAQDHDTPDIWLTLEADTQPVGVAYLAPERMTDGTWNLLLIAVHPDHQKQGRGTQLLEDTERRLRERGQRMLLVETLGLDDFEYVRRFYLNHGFEHEARIRDYYGPELDKIVFRKLLTV